MFVRIAIKIKIRKTNLDNIDFIEVSKNIIRELNMSYLVIHSPQFATISLKDNKNHFWITEGFTSKPLYTVSAGDHFLSGVITGFLGGLTPSEST